MQFINATYWLSLNCKVPIGQSTQILLQLIVEGDKTNVLYGLLNKQ